MTVAIETTNTRRTTAAAARPEAGRRAGGRGAWALADQVLMSGSNFVTMVVAARAMHPGAFGAFSLAYSALLFANTFQTALVTQPHNVLGTARSGREYAAYTTATALSQVALSALAGLVAVAAGVACHLAGWGAGGLLLALGPTIVAWQGQEFGRRVLYTEGRIGLAFAADVVSYGVQALLFVWLWRATRLTPQAALYAIAGTSAVAGVFAAGCLRERFTPRPDRAAVRENWRFGKWLAGAEILNWCSSVYMYQYLAAAALGTAASGVLKAAQTVFGPARVFAFFLQTVLPIRFSRTLAEHGPTEMRRQFRKTYAVGAVLGGTYCAAVALLARPIMGLLYGAEYADSAGVLALYAVAMFLWYTEMMLSAAATARRRTRNIFIGYVYGSVISLALGWVLIKHLGPAGGVVGIILTTCCVSARLLVSSRGERTTSGNNGGLAGLPPATECDILSRLLATLDNERIPYCVLHGYEGYPEAVDSDVDVLVDRASLGTLERVLRESRRQLGAEVVQWVRDDALYVVLAAPAGDGRAPALLRLHACWDVRLGGRVLYRGEDVLTSKRPLRGFWVPAPRHEFVATLARRAVKGPLDETTAAHLAALYAAGGEAVAFEFARKWSPETERELAGRVGSAEALRAWLPALKRELLASLKDGPPWWTEAAARVRRWASPPGLHVVFLGPDGVGKSTVLELSRRDLSGAFLGTTYRTYAPMVLRRAPAEGKGPMPHSLKPRSKAAALAKAGYWLVYYTAGYLPTAYRDRARGALAINHRYLLDALVDPRRYRYSGPVWLLRAIWGVCPKPDLVLLLDAPAEVILARKQELPLEETRRQCEAYRRLVTPLPYGRVIDASRTIEEVVADVDRVVLETLAARTAGRVGVGAENGGER